MSNNLTCHALCCFIEDQYDPMIEHTYSEEACSTETVVSRILIAYLF